MITMATTMPAKASMGKTGRRIRWPMLLPYPLLVRSKAPVEQTETGRGAACCGHEASGSVAQSAGVKISATTTERTIADTMVTENWR